MLLYVDSNFASPYALSCFVALTEKGLPFHWKPLNLAQKEHEVAAYVNDSLTARVPALVDGELALSESSAIDEYLEDAYPAPQFPSLYPRDVQQKARARQVQAWIRSDLMPIREERSTATLFMGEPIKPLSPAALAAANRLFAFAQRVLPQGQPNLFGDWSIADTDLGIMLNRLARNGDAVPERLREYAQRQWDRPAVAAWRKLSGN
jgi:glutathione S-transferase